MILSVCIKDYLTPEEQINKLKEHKKNIENFIKDIELENPKCPECRKRYKYTTYEYKCETELFENGRKERVIYGYCARGHKIRLPETAKIMASKINLGKMINTIDYDYQE